MFSKPTENKKIKYVDFLCLRLYSVGMVTRLTVKVAEMITARSINMKAVDFKVISSNEWAEKMTDNEVANWVESMLECGRTEAIGYWTARKMVRCPYNKPLAIV